MGRRPRRAHAASSSASRSGSMFHVARSASTNTGAAPWKVDAVLLETATAWGMPV